MGLGCFLLFLTVMGFYMVYYGLQDGDTVLTIVGLFFVAPVVIGVIAMLFYDKEKDEAKQAEAKKRLDDKINEKFNEEGLKEVAQQYRTFNCSVIGLDEKNRKICFLDSESKVKRESTMLYLGLSDSLQFKSRSVGYNDILESEVIVDGETVTKTSRASQVGGAVLGGLIAGGVGAIIGGLSGKTSSSEKIKTINLKLIVNDTNNPLLIIPFFDEAMAVAKTDEKVVKAKEEVMHWHSILKVIMDTVDKEDAKNNINELKNSANSALNNADEIRKLHDLFKEGIITQEEFEAHKKKLIAQ